ncbi:MULTISPECIES: bifunctional 2-polyprenyl-6-hydroxyphenol methylase/3-demethylubiquinol 3-O-methyltransferase UbiG [unclassified Devosia]|uniref:bifunctional 2-polyprenyl-6-hydroxyphenol methylase/3-demethylubiquinol 3-O-methyltransferase UbiG n=1 Tax=unclassified Devosia TaxID=196773 RepID=UPI0015FA9541|nr:MULTISPECIES: bifunctional 2-polyprenyl-6-hydroxyphenol methylase/3-demethylubiquinol 3-O-methyltransferase UbiG [unclassified Devosia]MBJ6989176.1 bifunctional 2-polyprenyl-6-hydroxyphenol methylase/3-demethylubiquinol 3-O-methyltransferase UbiG [Devosia sp. MC521]QMW62287.1 bifunctional 2-polyprenyl-6-hydroxyphenol methylase/3-demethylubiquinol 3-O-methyltransferase UbiG [Devosia sp. MC521]
MTNTTVNDAEIAKFTAMAEEWWDPTGKFKPLHKFNPVRLSYIRDKLVARFGRDANSIRPFEGIRILDVGCGGGLLCEPLTRLGATVTGVDAAERNIAIAKIHAEQGGLDIDYRATTSEALVAAGESYDVVLNMEVVEHVDNVPLYMKSCADLVAPGGLMFTATLNRTARALALAVIGAEYVLRWLPRGTHDWNKFLTPEEIIAELRRNGLNVTDQSGVSYNPLSGEWRLSRDMAVNYMVVAERQK